LPFAGLTDCSPVRTQSGIVNTLPLKAIRLLAGGEAKIGGTLASVIYGAAPGVPPRGAPSGSVHLETRDSPLRKASS
jgi:hypothetical protein